MDNVTFVKIENREGVEQEHAIIAHADESFTTMTKAHYKAQQVEHLTEIVPGAN